MTIKEGSWIFRTMELGLLCRGISWTDPLILYTLGAGWSQPITLGWKLVAMPRRTTIAIEYHSYLYFSLLACCTRTRSGLRWHGYSFRQGWISLIGRCYQDLGKQRLMSSFGGWRQRAVILEKSPTLTRGKHCQKKIYCRLIIAPSRGTRSRE